MSDKKLLIHVRRGEENYELIAVAKEKEAWFLVPEELRDLKLEVHSELLKLKTVISSIKSISKIGGYRKIAVRFKPELAEKYLDEDENFCINDYYLEEQSPKFIESDEEKTGDKIFFIERIKELERRVASANLLTLREIEQKFLIGKFNGRQDGCTWMKLFERECDRFQLSDDVVKVEALRLFLAGNVTEWYSSSLIKLPASNWNIWKDSFLLLYGQKCWSNIRQAFNYRYVFGWEKFINTEDGCCYAQVNIESLPFEGVIG
ncbi:hypothetical protein O3M35_012440 [Rhynocoris fuscipes]|uniref:Uncharacterized protein n=1 Tax=Rhynocoris fuscipes TaxID=488301 RepID=A0AAW1CT38_9HEMI